MNKARRQLPPSQKTSRASALFVLACALFAILPANAATQAIRATAPVKNFRLPLFDEQNRLSLHVTAAEAHIIDNTRIDITDIRLAQYEYPKDADPALRLSPQQTGTLTSATATVRIDQQVIGGPDTVTLLREDLEVSGKQWTYSHKDQKVILNDDAKVIFNAPLPDVLNTGITPTVKKKQAAADQTPTSSK